MDIAENIKKIRKESGMLQKQVAIELGVDQSNYNKIESGQRQPSIEVLYKFSKLFGISIDQIVEGKNETPREITVEDKTTSEKIRLVQQLEEEDRNVVFKVIDSMLTKNKFKQFFSEQFGKQ